MMEKNGAKQIVGKMPLRRKVSAGGGVVPAEHSSLPVHNILRGIVGGSREILKIELVVRIGQHGQNVVLQQSAEKREIGIQTHSFGDLSGE